MKLNSLAPNARYDLEHGKPSVFEQDNDGSNLYRYNIEPEMGIPDGQTEETQVVGNVVKSVFGKSRQRQL